jgi:predicted alpha/beta-fold hydrolase
LTVASTAPPYVAPSWLPGPHAQTIWPLAIKGVVPAYRRERWDTPDGDFIDLDWVGNKAAAACVVLFHGLEGSSRSHYARSLMRAVEAHGWCGVVVHFRGCSGEPNRLARAYHSGDSAEIDWVLRRIANDVSAPLFVAGVSLGGNALLKWLGEQGTAAASVVRGAAAVCAPVDLAAANVALTQGFNRIYARHFLRSLIPAALAKHQRFPGLFDPTRVRAARSLGEFDDAVTAPLHGFAGADDYYARSSAKQFLGAIRLPSLLLHAANDPFLPLDALPPRAAIASAVELEIVAEGGHVGFVSAGVPGHLDWLPQRLLHFFRTLLP